MNSSTCAERDSGQLSSSAMAPVTAFCWGFFGTLYKDDLKGAWDAGTSLPAVGGSGQRMLRTVALESCEPGVTARPPLWTSGNVNEVLGFSELAPMCEL